MQIRRAIWLCVGSAGLVAAACAPQDPPTITPPPAGSSPQGTGAPGASRSFEITLPPPRAVGTIEPVTIGDELIAYQDAGGKFSLTVPAGWAESRKTAELTGDAKLGTVFAAPNRNGLLSVTQFDNGRVPEALGATANGVMKLTGLSGEPDFTELDRQNVNGREGKAMLVEVTYSRSIGVPMHGLLLFQIDGTTFSMVNLAVEQGSWNENESRIREVLASYRGPAAAGQ